MGANMGALLWGAGIGLLTFMPFVVAVRSKRLMRDLGIKWCFACLGGSFVIAVAAFAICHRVAPGNMLVFGLATVVTFVVALLCFSVWYFACARK